MSKVPLTPSQVGRSIRILFAIQLVSMGAMEMSGPFWPVHLKSLNPSDFLFGFSGIAVYVGPMLGIMLTSSFWGRMGDRHGHKPMILRALLGLSVTQLALAYAADIGTILALRFLQGACAGFIAPAQAYGVSIESPLRRARLFAYLQVSTNVGSLAGAIAGGVILDLATFFWINIVASFLCAVCAAAAYCLLPGEPTSRTDLDAPMSRSTVVSQGAGAASLSIWRSTPVVGLLGIMGLLLVSRMISQTPFSLYVKSMFDVSNGLVGLCYGLLALGFVLSASRWARFFEDKSLHSALSRMAYVVAACAALMVAAGITRSIVVFAMVYLTWGVLLGATTPVLISLVSRTAGGLGQGHVLGVAQSAAQLSSITGIALGVLVSQAFGLQYTYFLVSFFYVLAVFAILSMRRVSVAPDLQRCYRS